jgi:hypothetical protein
MTPAQRYLLGIDWPRVVRFSLTRIVLGTLVVILPVVAVQWAASKLTLPRMTVVALSAIVSAAIGYAAFRAYVPLMEQRAAIEFAPQGALRELAGGLLIGSALFASTIGILAWLGVYHVTGYGSFLKPRHSVRRGGDGRRARRDRVSGPHIQDRRRIARDRLGPRDLGDSVRCDPSDRSECYRSRSARHHFRGGHSARRGIRPDAPSVAVHRLARCVEFHAVRNLRRRGVGNRVEGAVARHTERSNLALRRWVRRGRIAGGSRAVCDCGGYFLAQAKQKNRFIQPFWRVRSSPPRYGITP